MRKKAYLIDLYRQRCEAQSYFCAILERLKVTLKDIPDMQLPPMPKPPPFNPKTLPPPTKRRVQAPDAPFTLGSELYVSLGEALDLTAISGEQRVRGQIVRFIGNANNGVKSIGKVVTIKVSRPNPNHRPGGGAAILVMESVSLDGKDVPVTTRSVPRSVPGPGSNYFGPGVLRAGTRLVFVVEP